MSWNADKACIHAAVEARLTSAWSIDMESKCSQEKEQNSLCIFVSYPGRYFWAIVRFTARNGAGDRVAKIRQLKVKVNTRHSEPE